VYESFYKLRTKPFRLSPDPGFFFASRGHKRALAYLRYGLSQGEGFVVITGAPGTGKTTLAQILLKEMGQSDVVVAHLTTTQLEADDMLRMVVASLGLRYEGLDKAGLLKTLESFLLARSRERKRVLLVVDEAQNLPAKSIEELRMLSNLQVGDKALLQTFLLGQAQFRQMLEHPDLEQLRQRVIANYHLSSLAADECQSYIESRLKQAGWQGDPHFSEPAFARIHEYTEGVPRRINMLCDRVLLFGALEERHEIGEEILHQVTDELQQEISGRPLEAVDPGTLLSEDAPASVSDAPPAAMDQAAEALGEEVGSPSDEAGLEASLEEESPAEEPLAAEAMSAVRGEETVVEPGGPEDAVLDRAEPDETWHRPVPQVDTTEHHQEDEAAEARTTDKERFRVIPGGKGAPSAPDGDNDVAPAAGAAMAVNARRQDSPEPEEVVLRKILRLVLAFHRSPRSFPGLDDPTQPLPKGIRQVLQLAVSDDQVLRDLRQIAIMGISPAMLRAAIRYFVRRVLFLPGGDDYRVLGLSPGASTAEIEIHYGLLMRLMRQEKPQPGEEGGVARIGEAYERLCQGEHGAKDDEAAAKELGDIEDIEDIEELDLDLAPNLGVDGRGRSYRSAADADALVAEDKGSTRLLVRNAVLVAGAVVITFVLYLTQVRTPEVPTPVETAAVSAPLSEMGEGTEAEAANGQNALAAAAPVSEADSALSLGQTDDLEPGTTEHPGTAPETAVAEDTANTTVAEAPAVEPADKAQEEAAALVAELRAQAETADKARREAEAKAKAEAEARAMAEAKMKAEAQARAAAEVKAKAESQARLAAEAKAKAEREAKAKAEAEAAAAVARAKAEAKAKATAMAPQSAPTVKTAPAAGAVASAATSVASAVPAQARVLEEANSSAVAAAAKDTLAAPATAKTQPETEISLPELQKVIQRFQHAYEKGDLAEIGSLFAPKARTNNQTDVAGIRSDYQKFFDKTVERQLAFNGLAWEREPGYARGMGEYEVVTRLKGKQAQNHSQGKFTIQLERNAKGVQITRFYFDENTQQAVSPGMNDNELNRLMDTFISTYEAGDIEAFMRLFAADAQTNSRSSVAGIRKDYAGLFKNTLARKLKLENLHWSRDGAIARGEANYVVQVQSAGRSANVYKGSLWVQVEQREGRPLITNFAFAE
jgi:general secretion pathway protein A